MVLTRFSTQLLKVLISRESELCWAATVTHESLGTIGKFEEPNSMQKRGSSVCTNLSSCVEGGENDHWEEQRPEEELLPSFLFDDVQLVVVSECTGHFLICHVISILLNKDHELQTLWLGCSNNIWQTTQTGRCSPFGSPRDVPDR